MLTSVAQSCLTLCDPMDCSMPGLLSITNSQSLPKLMSFESVMPSNHLILCCPLLFPLSIFLSIRVFSNKSALCSLTIFLFLFFWLYYFLYILLQRHYFVNKGPSSQGYGFPSGHARMWELDYKESWAPKNWCFWTVVLEKTLESPLDCKEIQPVHPKISPGCSLEGLVLKLKLQYFGHLIQRADLFEKTLMLGKIEGRRKRGRQRMR